MNKQVKRWWREMDTEQMWLPKISIRTAVYLNYFTNLLYVWISPKNTFQEIHIWINLQNPSERGISWIWNPFSDFSKEHDIWKQIMKSGFGVFQTNTPSIKKESVFFFFFFFFGGGGGGGGGWVTNSKGKTGYLTNVIWEFVQDSPGKGTNLQLSWEACWPALHPLGKLLFHKTGCNIMFKHEQKSK